MNINGLQVLTPYGWYVASEGERLSLAPGDVLRVGVSVDYRGNAQELTLYSAVGRRGTLWFDEAFYARAVLMCPESLSSFTIIDTFVDILIPDRPGTAYDLYVKVEERPSVIAYLDTCIDITSAPGGWESITMILPMMMMLMMLPLITGMMGEEEKDEGATITKET